MKRNIILFEVEYGYEACCILEGFDYTIALVYPRGRKLLVAPISLDVKSVWVNTVSEAEALIQHWADTATDEQIRHELRKELQ